MKKQTLIIIILCVLVAVVIALSVLGVIGPPQGSFAGYSRNETPPTVSPPNTLPEIGSPWDQSLPTTP